MFKIRTEPVIEGTVPYAWDVASIYQCTWYAYYRALEVGFSAPTWWDRETRTGSYTNAKEWLENYRDPWEVKGTDWIPVPGDILVYTDDSYGHVIFCETDTMTSEYRSGNKDSFRNAKIGDYKGELLGILHYPYESVLPVERNENVVQIETKDEQLRIRTKPSLNGEIVGHVQLGYYNVLATEEADGYTWYEIAENRWCANVETVYLPSESNDFVKQIEVWANEMVSQVKQKDKTISDLKSDMKEIQNISKKWE